MQLTLTSASLKEVIAGPVKGYYLAAYAIEQRGGYASYYKVCNGEPASYWEALCLIKGKAPGRHATAQAALQEAQDLARAEIANMPALQRLPVFKERRGFYLSEWYALVTGTFQLDAHNAFA